MMDEPERYSPETRFVFYRSLYRDLRARLDKEMPAVKLEISHWGPLDYWTDDQYANFATLYQATDRIRLMPYPDLNEGPLSDVYWQILRSRRLMQLAGRELPQVVILQSWALPENPKLPTIDEMRVMAYSAVLGGADVLSFFNYDPQQWAQTPGFTEGFTRLMRELTQFSRQYREATVESRMNRAGVLSAVIKPKAGYATSIVVNTNRDAVDGLAALEVKIEVSGPQIAMPPPAVRNSGCRVRFPCLRFFRLRRR
jgi:hypothetical protein